MNRTLISNVMSLTLLLGVVCSSAFAQATFTDITTSAGVDNSTSGEQRVATSVAAGDYDGDGDVDLYVTNFASGTAVGASINRLYRNEGSNTFTDVAGQTGVADSRNSFDSAWVDYDGDNDLDLYVVNIVEQDQLYRNNGTNFSRVTSSAGVNVISQGDETAVAWADYDGDGNVDYYLCKRRFRNSLFRNNGDGSFSEVGQSAGVADTRDSQGAAWGDYDDDGDADLYVVNREQNNALYRNDGNGRFTEVACAASIDNTDVGRSAVWIDFDEDSDLDLFVANVGANALYRNEGNGIFTDVASDGLAATAIAWISWIGVWNDFDGDNETDLFVVNGGESADGQASTLFLQSSSIFTDGTSDSGLSTSASYGVDGIAADVDGDGDPDLYLVNGQFPSFEASTLYRNDTP